MLGSSITTTEYNRNWRKRNPEKCAANAKRCREANLEVYKERERVWRAANKNKRVAAARRRRLANPAKEKAYAESNRFSIPLYKSKHQARKSGYVACTATPLELKEAFNGKCHVCCTVEGKTKLHADHCHITGKFRGWLCRSCNTVLGLLHDSPERIENLLAYLKAKS